MTSRIWNSALDDELRRLRKENMKWADISIILHIPWYTCSNHFYKLRDEIETTKRRHVKRPCIMCHKVEVEGWSYCEACRSTVASKDTPYNF